MNTLEPLVTTLEELAAVHGIIVWKDAIGEAWVAGSIRLALPHDGSRYSYSSQWMPMGIGATWMEAASAAIHRKVVARDEAAELRAALEDVWRWLKSEFPAAPDSGDSVEKFAEQIWLTVCAALAAPEEGE